MYINQTTVEAGMTDNSIDPVWHKFLRNAEFV